MSDSKETKQAPAMTDEQFIAEHGHQLARMMGIDAYDLADRDAQILARLKAPDVEAGVRDERAAVIERMARAMNMVTDGHERYFSGYIESATAAYEAASASEPDNTDDIAIDLFARAMKDKMAQARARGRSGWEGMEPVDLSRMLREHVDKGDPRDVANFCMMLWHHSARIARASEAAAGEQLDLSLEAQLADAKADVARLHSEKMALLEKYVYAAPQPASEQQADHVLVPRELLQDLIDDVEEYAASRKFKAREVVWRDERIVRARDILSAVSERKGECAHDWKLSATHRDGNSPWVCAKCGIHEQQAARGPIAEFHFGLGEVVVQAVRVSDFQFPGIAIFPASMPGVIGESAKREGNIESVLDKSVLLVFRDESQRNAVEDALVGIFATKGDGHADE